MTPNILLEESQVVRQEAAKLLELTDVANYLKRFGEVNLIGSYSYNVMMARDLDFHIIIKEFNQQLVKDFFDYAVDSGFFEEIIFHDKHKFNKEAAARYASKNALDSYYFGLRTIFNSESWQIGINFITQPQAASVEVGKLFETATDDQREQILVFKKLVKDQNLKVSSAYLYRAVLEKSITDSEGLFSYLQTIGYKF